jgi:hypothetical protein
MVAFQTLIHLLVLPLCHHLFVHVHPLFALYRRLFVLFNSLFNMYVYK